MRTYHSCQLHQDLMERAGVRSPKCSIQNGTKTKILQNPNLQHQRLPTAEMVRSSNGTKITVSSTATESYTLRGLPFWRIVSTVSRCILAKVFSNVRRLAIAWVRSRACGGESATVTVLSSTLRVQIR